MEEATFSGADSLTLGLAIDIEGRFNKKIYCSKGQEILYKGAAAERSNGILMVVNSVYERMVELQPEITLGMVTAILKADLCPGDVMAKLGGLTNEKGLNGFIVVADTIERIATDAGLGEDALGVTSIAVALKKELEGVSEPKLRAATTEIAELA